MHILGAHMSISGAKCPFQVLIRTKVYILKRYSPSDSFCTFFSESVF